MICDPLTTFIMGPLYLQLMVFGTLSFMGIV